MLRVGDRILLEVTGLTHAGEGVGRWDGMVVFVPGAIPQDIVSVVITEVRRRFARGKAEEIRVASPLRSPEAGCPVFPHCGGCQLSQVSYPAQLDLKKGLVEQALSRLGKLTGVRVLPVMGGEPWYYRNKAQVPVGGSPGTVALGFYARGTHRVVDAATCRVQHPTNNRIIAEVRRLLDGYRVVPYDEKTGTGQVRHVVARVAVRTGESLAVLVTSGPELAHAEEIASALMRGVPGLVGVVQNINDRRTNVVLGPVNRVIAGRGYIEEILLGLRFRISVGSFFQVNPLQAEKLYLRVLDYAILEGKEEVVDAYCGVGTISLVLARAARRVQGIEESSAAVADAWTNARLNRIENVAFATGLVEEELEAMAARGERAAAVVLDPPRKGCEVRALEAVVRLGPRRVVYVSCNPATLARDVGWLGGRGYRVVEVQPVDMFPQTPHVECVALLVGQGRFPRGNAEFEKRSRGEVQVEP